MPRETTAASAAPAPKTRPPRTRTRNSWRHTRESKNFTHITAVKGAPVGFHAMAFAHTYARALGTALRANPVTARLTVPQFQTLHLLAANDDGCGTELARAMGCQPQTMTTILHSLRRQGLITDLEAKEGQGRANLVEMTSAGRGVLAAARRAAKAVDAAVSGEYSYDGLEQKVLIDLLTRGRRVLTPEDD